MIFHACHGKVRKPSSSGNKDCPDITEMVDFGLKDYKGTWYEVFTSIKPSSTKSRCERMSYSLTKYGSLSIYRKYITANGLQMKMLGVAAELDSSSISSFYPAFPSESKTFDVLGTDYKTFSLLYICDMDYNVWILSRNATIDREHLKLALNILAAQGLTNFYLYPTDQQNCEFSNF
jgi:lipocalin